MLKIIDNKGNATEATCYFGNNIWDFFINLPAFWLANEFIEILWFRNL